jgi:voltage-gated potassium channel
MEGRLTGNLIKRKPKTTPWLKPWLTNKILLISIAWQILGIVVLEVLPEGSGDEQIEAAVVPMILMQAIHLVLVVLTSIKLVKQILHRTVSPWFLAQSYLSTILLYSGMYTMLWKIFAKTVAPFAGPIMIVNTDFQWLLTWLTFLYFSAATMTTVGYGDIYPAVWFTQLIVTTEMLFSVMYSAVILSIGLQHFTGSTYVKKGEHKRRATDLFLTQPIIELFDESFKKLTRSASKVHRGDAGVELEV